MTNSIKKVLDDEGIFVFEVSYLLDVVQKNLIGTIFHEHLCYHSVISLFSLKNSINNGKILSAILFEPCGVVCAVSK